MADVYSDQARHVPASFASAKWFTSVIHSVSYAPLTKLGVGMVDVKLVAVGWSARKDIIGKTVYNENDQRVGTIEDLIVAPDTAISFAIVGAGGFAGVGRHDVAIPVRQIQLQDDGKFVLPGATEEAIKSLPRFEYAKSEKE